MQPAQSEDQQLYWIWSILLSFSVMDPDPHLFGFLDSDVDPHQLVADPDPT